MLPETYLGKFKFLWGLHYEKVKIRSAYAFIMKLIKKNSVPFKGVSTLAAIDNFSQISRLKLKESNFFCQRKKLFKMC